MAGNSGESGRSVASKAIAVLLTFTHGGAYSLSEIARLTGFPLSTTHRLLGELSGWGVLERTEDNQYRVGLPLRMIGNEVPHTPGMYERARQVMDDLSAATRSTVRLGVQENLRVAFIEKRTHTRPVATPKTAPTVPLHATAMGKALLAFAPHEVVERVIAAGLRRYTPFTITTPGRLRQALATTRLTHVAVSAREFELESTAVAVPIFGAGLGAGGTVRTMVAALEIQASHPQADPRILQPAVIVAARSLTRELVTSRAPGQLRLTAEHRLAGVGGNGS
jgi:DNA-binding IclR family transcriptional regulator